MSTEPSDWVPPAHWAEAETATALAGEITDDPTEVALNHFRDGTLLVLAVVVHSHGASKRELHRMTGRSWLTLGLALHGLQRAGLLEREPRVGEDHWLATTKGTTLGVTPYVSRLLRASHSVRGTLEWTVGRFTELGSPHGPPIFSPAFTLSDINDPAVLAEAFRDGTHSDRVYAVAKLVALRDPSSAAALCEVAQRRGEEELLARKAVVALGHFDSPEVIRTLIEIAAERDSLMREAAARSLGRLHARDAETVLGDLLQYPSEPVRAAAIHALEQIGDLWSAEQIAVGLNDQALEVRHFARRALIRVGAVEQLRASPRIPPFGFIDAHRAGLTAARRRSRQGQGRS